MDRPQCIGQTIADVQTPAIQAFEILQLYLELLSIRMALIDKTRDIPPDMIEAISSLIYASQRTSELQASTIGIGCSGLNDHYMCP